MLKHTMEGITKKWYVLKTISGQENKIKIHLENEVHHLKMDSLLGKVLVPTEQVIQVRNGKKMTKEKVYYPGYVFVELALEGEMEHIVKSLPGVISFLSETKGGDPIPMRKAEINRMLGRMDELSEHVEHLITPYKLGEAVKVIGGPFNGFNGTIEHINEEKRRVKVIVLIFGRKTPMELGFSEVEKI